MSNGRLISVADEKEFFLRLLRTIGSVTETIQQHSQPDLRMEPEPQQQQQQQQQQQKMTVDTQSEKEQARSAARALIVNLIRIATDHDELSKTGGADGHLRHSARAMLGAADSDGLTLLHYAAALGFAEAVSMLISHGMATPNMVDNEGCTALHWASAHGQESVVALLLKAGASQLKNSDGLTPLGETGRQIDRRRLNSCPMLLLLLLLLLLFT